MRHVEIAREQLVPAYVKALHREVQHGQLTEEHSRKGVITLRCGLRRIELLKRELLP